MPRRASLEKDTGGEEGANASYLDSFLQRVTEESNLPGDVKRSLSMLRELDTQGQDIFERMQKLSKNHITRAKRSVQSGSQPDEELLHKARKSFRELMDIDDEKVKVADNMCAQITKELLHCERELHKFADELKEKGQLKNPIVKVDSSAQIAASAANLASSAAAASAAAAAAAAAAASSAQPGAMGLNVNSFTTPGNALPPSEMPPAPTTAGKRGRQPNLSFFGGGDEPTARASAHSHKRGRGRKQSTKEAERQRLAADTMGSPRVDAGLTQHGDYARQYNPYGGIRAQPKDTYPEASIPLASREDSNRPLTGAVLPPPDYIIPDRAKVCCRPQAQKGAPAQDWILGTVLRYNAQQGKYIVLDDDQDEQGNLVSGGTQQIVPAKYCLPLPLFEPSMYTQLNEFPRGALVLALYPDTTCFYKGMVHTPPSERRQLPPRDYLIEFEDESEVSGRSEPIRVPQKYVMPFMQ